MPIPLPNLDDRKYSDLVEEALTLIPTYAPEGAPGHPGETARPWTNYNPSDPGITLVELFAYLAEMLVYRLNRVPAANIVAFLKLINGPEWQPTRDPHADAEREYELLVEDIRKTVLKLRAPHRGVTCRDFERLALAADPMIARVRCVPRRDLDAPLDRTLEKAGHISFVIISRGFPLDILRFDGNYTELTAEMSSVDGTASLLGASGQFLYVGSTTTFGSFSFHLEDRGSNYQLRVEYFDGSGWVQLTEAGHDLSDSTNHWQSSGTLTFTVPADWQPTSVDEISRYWLRVSTTTEPSPPARATQILRDLPGSLVDGFDVLSFDGLDYVNRTAEASAEGGTGFPLNMDPSHFLYIGSTSIFGSVSFHLDGKGKQYGLSFGYFDGQDWTALESWDHDLEDQTRDWTSDGLVRFAAPADWTRTSVNEVTRYWIRVSTTTAPTTVATATRIVRDLIQSAKDFLEPRRLITTRVHVVSPRYVPVGVRLTIVLMPDEVERTMRPRVVEAIQRFLDPLIGGPDGDGWPFGRNVYVSEIYQLLDLLPGVDYVTRTGGQDELTAAEARRRRPVAGKLVAVEIDADELVLAPADKIRLTFQQPLRT